MYREEKYWKGEGGMGRARRDGKEEGRTEKVRKGRGRVDRGLERGREGMG